MVVLKGSVADRYREAAIRDFHVDGELVIPDNATVVSTKDGVKVQAWVIISADEPEVG